MASWHQDYHLFPELTVAQNVFGVNVAQPRRRWTRAVDRVEVERTVEQLFTDLRIEIAPERKVYELGPAEKKFVEIASSMLLGPRFLILDEPTASLEPSGAKSVLDLMEHLRSQGVGLAFVSHRLDEVMSVSDQVTVLRDGVVAVASDISEFDEVRLAHEITGGMDQKEAAHRRHWKSSGDVRVKVSGLRVGPGRPEISFEAERGEIFGTHRPAGQRRRDRGQDARGSPADGGHRRTRRQDHVDPRSEKGLQSRYRVHPRGQEVGRARQRAEHCRKHRAALARSDVPGGVLNWPAIRGRAEEYREDLSIKAQNSEQPIWTLSGGNQQKVMLAKWLASGVDVLAIEEPTHGVDIGAKLQVHDLLRRFAEQGGTVIVASTDVGEALDLCDRIGVMRHGALTSVVSSADLSRTAVTVLGTKDPEQMLEEMIESEAASGAQENG